MNQQAAFVLLLFSYVIKPVGGDGGGATWPRSRNAARVRGRGP